MSGESLQMADRCLMFLGVAQIIQILRLQDVSLKANLPNLLYTIL